MSEPPIQSRRGLSIAVALLSTVLALAGTEFLGRLWMGRIAGISDRPPSPSMLALAFEPYLMFGFQYGWFEDVEKDSMAEAEGPQAYGYRSAGPMYLFDFDRPIMSIAERGHFMFEGDELADNRKVPTLRVFVVGASVAQGVGSSSHETTWHVILERALTHALGRDVHLIVGAVPGFVSTQERIALELMVLPRCPDAVIVLNGWDDAALPGMLGSRPGDPINSGLLYEHYFPSTSELNRMLVRQSALYRYFYHRRILDVLEEHRARIAGSQQRLDLYRRSTAGVYLDNVARMLDACERSGVPCGVFLQPARSLIDEGKLGPQGWAVQESLEKASYEAIRSGIAAMPQRDRVHDLTGIFEPGREWFVDPVHFGDDGHAVLAKSMLPIVERMMRSDLREAGADPCAR
jgi:lysophospholipase L1-like esterase